MAKTKGGNPVIGTVPCRDPECTETATVHQIQSGSREGELYTRCPNCKANQSTSELFQNYLRKNTEFRPGYEHLAETEKAESHDVPEPDDDESIDEPETQEEPKKSGGIVLGAIALVSIVAGAILSGGKK